MRCSVLEVHAERMVLDKYPLVSRFISFLKCVFLVHTIFFVVGCGGSEPAPEPDSSLPRGFKIDSGSPLNGETDVSLTSGTFFHFTDVLDEERLTADQILFYDLTDDVLVETTYSYDPVFGYLSIDPVHRLLPQHDYRVAIHHSVANIKGDTLGNTIYTEFTTTALEPFMVVDVNPANELMEVGLDRNLTVDLSNYFLFDSVNEETVTLHNLTKNTPVPIEVGPKTIIHSQSTSENKYSGIKINPVYRLSRFSEFEIRVSDEIRDLDNQKLTKFSSRFYTTNNTAIPVPEVISTESIKSQVSTDHQLYIQFSDELEPTTIDPGDRFVRNLSTGRWVKTRAWIDGKRLVIMPVEPLEYSTYYDFGIYGVENSIIQNIFGDVVSARYSWKFLTTKPPE